jgi:hypothetical protein
MNRNLIAALAIVSIFSATPAAATHTTAPIVDSIDGTGPNNFSGSLSNPADSSDWYSFAADAGDNVAIDMQSAQFDTYLQLYRAPSTPAPGDARATFTLVTEDDDGGGGLNSLISIPSLSQSGFYVIAAGSFSGETDPLGNYSLSVSGSIRAVPEPSAAILAAGAALLLGCRRRRLANSRR